MNSNREISRQALVLALTVILFYAFFTLFQDERVFSKTLGKVTGTYQKLEGDWNIAFEKKPYKKIDSVLLVNWDAVGYDYLRQHSPSNEDLRSSYGFFPMFPWVWKLTHLPVKYIGILNFLLFGVGWMILMRLFSDPSLRTTSERMMLFILGVSVPSVAVFFIPYSEAVFTLFFILALAGLVKRKYWVYFIFMALSAMSRASVIIVIASMLATCTWFLLKSRDIRHFLRETGLLLLPVVTGMIIVFIWHYLYSGNLFKYYEVQSTYWTNNLQWPSKLGDWSVEGFGMNIGSIVLLVIPGLIWFFSVRSPQFTVGSPQSTVGSPEHDIDNPKSQIPNPNSQIPNPKSASVFSGDLRMIKEFFLVNAIVFFFGFFLYILMFRGGSIHCLHRFIVSSPYFYIFFLLMADRAIAMKRSYVLAVMLPLFAAGLLFILLFPIDRGISFRDSGFFLFACVMFSPVLLHGKSRYLQATVAAGIWIWAVIWFTFLYNSYISCAWIWA